MVLLIVNWVTTIVLVATIIITSCATIVIIRRNIHFGDVTVFVIFINMLILQLIYYIWKG